TDWGVRLRRRHGVGVAHHRSPISRPKQDHPIGRSWTPKDRVRLDDYDRAEPPLLPRPLGADPSFPQMAGVSFSGLDDRTVDVHTPPSRRAARARHTACTCAKLRSGTNVGGTMRALHVFMLAVLAGWPAAAGAQTADKIFLNGKIVTVDDRFTI